MTVSGGGRVPPRPLGVVPMNTWGLSGSSIDGVEALNDQQRAVLRCLARGLADHEIARVLAISQEQVADEVAEILRVLSLRDRMAAVVFAHETGIIRLPLPR
jgi:DNA-binding NarL/FixJ family response regulator